MTGPRRLNLPLLPELAAPDDAKPRMEAARKQLGGPGDTDGLAGVTARVATRQGVHRVGVVLYADAREVDVWFEGSLVRRTARAELVTVDPAQHPELDAVIADVKVFAALCEGERVRWSTAEGAPGEGRMIEKCRYGALVATDDGRVLAVGFRRLWPAVAVSD